MGRSCGKAANEKVNVAIVGVGGRGRAHVDGIPKAGGNIVALCDVDDNNLGAAAKEHPAAHTYNDFRKMLDERHKEIDAVIVATPDHTHAVAAAAAMKLGKHVYCEKPLTHSIHEARYLTELAARQKVATQMGNQGHSGDNTRRIVEIVRSGAIGPVREVHAWTNRPIWPQGKDRPDGSDPVPDSLHWDLWLGPAPERPYVANSPLAIRVRPRARRRRDDRVYHPFAWRGWWDFGTGALGDMACHILDASFWALDLKYPTAVEALGGEPRKPESAPSWEIIRYEFPARRDMPELKLTWYDGGKRPPGGALRWREGHRWRRSVDRRQGQDLRPRRLRREARPAPQEGVRRLQEPRADPAPLARPPRRLPRRPARTPTGPPAPTSPTRDR